VDGDGLTRSCSPVVELLTFESSLVAVASKSFLSPWPLARTGSLLLRALPLSLPPLLSLSAPGHLSHHPKLGTGGMAWWGPRDGLVSATPCASRRVTRPSGEWGNGSLALSHCVCKHIQQCSLSVLGHECPVVVLPDRAMCFPTFSHLLSVNKTSSSSSSLCPSPSLPPSSPSLPLPLAHITTLAAPWTPR